LVTPLYRVEAAPSTFRELVGVFVNIFNVLVPVIFALAFLVFLWGVFQYLIFPGNEERKTKGKQIILWGIIVFAVMVSVWGIVNVIYSSVFFDLGAAQQRCINNPGLSGCSPL